MSSKKIGFIGAGNMAGAMVGGIVKSGFLPAENIYISNPHIDKSEALSKLYNVNVCRSNLDLIRNCNVIVLAVKPHIYGIVLDEIKDYLDKDTLIVTIAAGITIKYVKNYFKNPVRVIRTMPNTPALIGEGISAIAYEEPVNEEDVNFVKGMFSSFGLVEVINESMIDAFSSVCGSSPAFIDMVIEAMADAAVLMGLPRASAYKMAAQSVKGTASMVIETGKHPGALKDMVCSPGGTTIEGVRVLENKGLRGAVIEALIAAGNKAKAMGEAYKK
jgi:pyrroline-5-carboxylate reductase